VLLVGGAIGVASAVVAAAAIASGITRELLPNVPAPAAVLVAPAAASQYLATTMVQMAMGSARPRATMIGLAVSPVLLLVATAGVASVGGGAAEMIAAYTVAWAIAAGVAAIVVSRSVSVRLASARRLMGVGRPAALGDLANALSYRSDVLVLSLLAGPAAVGVYALAVQALEPLWILAGSAAGGLLISLPSQPPQTWKPTVVGATLRISAVTLVGAIAVVVLMPVLVTAAGPGFEAAPIVALAIAPAIVLLAASKTLSVVQLVSGRLGWSTLISGASLALNIAANVALIPLLGAVGAGLASVVSYGSSAALWTWALRRR
jgi:O-antigen/teichoic acid export membrane protein